MGSAESITKNKLLFDLRTKYLHVANMWEVEGGNWSPVQLSHCFDEVKQTQPEVKVKSVLQMIDYLEARFMDKKHIKNNQIVDGYSNVKKYAELRRTLQTFTKKKYGKASPRTLFPISQNTPCWISPSGSRNKVSGTVTGEV